MIKRRDGFRLCLAPEAESDLETIWVHTAETWLVAQADKYIEDLSAKFDQTSRHSKAR